MAGLNGTVVAMCNLTPIVLQTCPLFPETLATNQTQALKDILFFLTQKFQNMEKLRKA